MKKYKFIENTIQLYTLYFIILLVIHMTYNNIWRHIIIL